MRGEHRCAPAAAPGRASRMGGRQPAGARRATRRERSPVPGAGSRLDHRRPARAARPIHIANNIKALPKVLIHELLPATDAALPIALVRKQYPSKLLAALNLTP